MDKNVIFDGSILLDCDDATCDELQWDFDYIMNGFFNDYPCVMFRGDVKVWNGYYEPFYYATDSRELIKQLFCNGDVESYTVELYTDENNDLWFSGAHHDGRVLFCLRGLDYELYDSLQEYEYTEEEDIQNGVFSYDTLWNKAAKLG